MPNPASPRGRRRLQLVASCGDHQPSSSAHGARGSPDPPWPYGEPRARLELGKRCDPEPRRIGAEVCSASTVSLSSMYFLELRFVPLRRYALDGFLPSFLWLLLGPGHTGLLHSKSAFSAKEKTFAVGCKLRRPPAKQQCPRSQRQPRPSLALWGA